MLKLQLEGTAIITYRRRLTNIIQTGTIAVSAGRAILRIGIEIVFGHPQEKISSLGTDAAAFNELVAHGGEEFRQIIGE